MTGNVVNDETKHKIRMYMRPRRRMKDLYDQINDPDEDDDKPKFEVAHFDLAKAIKEKSKQL